MNLSSVMYTQALIDGLLIGGVYATIAVGLSLAFGVMRIVNWAHGELLMVSMFLSYFVYHEFGIDPYITMFFAALIMFLIGFLLQKNILSNLIVRDKSVEPLSVLMFTSGLGIFLSSLALAVFGGIPLTATTPYTGKTIIVGDFFISLPKTISFVIAIACTVMLYLFLQRSETGRAIRATAQDRKVAPLMGINMRRIYNITFGISTALVGISGALLIPYTSVMPEVGTAFSFKAFIIVILGGYGSVVGSLVGGLLIGVIEKEMTLMFSDTVAQTSVFIVFVLVLLFRPYGLFGKKNMR